ncbi:MAG TPA: FkbM family methyltransferase [Puia sp.]|nr:FkbM family methyltransferase [Puia sp.]
MGKSVTFDIRVINFLVRNLDKYIIWKQRKETKKSGKSWLSLFRDSDNIIHPLQDGLMIKLYKDSILSRFIYEGFETTEIKFLNYFLKEGDCFVDIGSNIGMFSLYASRMVGPSGLVIAFEPASETYKRMLENIKLNNIENIKPNLLGLSDKDEVLELNISSNGYEAWNTFVKTADKKFSLKEKVEVKSLDNFLRGNAIDINKISLIKLDVEGFEINVLKGSSELLASQNAPVFMVEFTDDNAISAGNCCHELYKLLLQYNYSWYSYDAALNKLNWEPMRLSYPYNNLIAVKNVGANEKASRLSLNIPRG